MEKFRTYQEWKSTRQGGFDKLPIKYAFSNEQFKTMMESWGLTENDTDKIVSLGYQGFYLKSDQSVIKEWLYRDSGKELEELMQDEEFAISAYYYEMCNHEYGINYDGVLDVLRCFGKEKLSDLSDEQLKYYRKAEEKYYHDAKENEWF